MARHALSTREQNAVNNQKITPLHQSADAIDREGDFLDSNCASSNKHHWNRFAFGRVYPQIFSEKENGAEPCAMQTECLFLARGESPRIRITLSFLQPTMREIGAFERIIERLPENGGFRFQNVPLLEVAGKSFQAWMEAIERKVSVIVNDSHAAVRMPFVFPACESREAIHDEDGGIAGVIFRRHDILEGRIEIKMTRLQGDLFRICARVVNLSSVKRDETDIPQKVLLRTFAATHFKLETDCGEFVSLLNAPPGFQAFADDCKNVACWPVLSGDRTTVIASQNIFGDFPQVAPVSSGDFADGGEIDEMPTVRVLTLPEVLP